MQYAAELSGVSAGQLDNSLKFLTRGAAEAARGGGAAKTAFQELGVSLLDSNGRLKDSDTLLMDVAERMSRLPDQADKVRLAMLIFGRDGAGMVNMLDAGAEGLRVLRREARDTGHVLGKDVTDFSEAYLDNITRLQKRLEGLLNFFGVQLMPTFNEAVLTVTEWLDANRELVKGKIEHWAKRITKVVKDLLDPSSELRLRIDEIIESFAKWGDRIEPLVNFLGGPMNTAVLALAAWVGGPLVTALTVASFAFAKLSVAMLTTPLGPILLGLLAVGAVAYVLYKKWDDFLAYWGGLWGRVGAAFKEGFFSGFVALWKEFNPVTHVIRGLDAVLEYFTGFSLIDAGSRMVESFMDGLKAKWVAVQTWVRDSIAGLFGWLPKSIQSRLGIGVDVTPNLTKLGGSVAGVGSIAVPELSAVPKNAATDPRVAAVQALSLEPVNVSKGGNVYNSRTVNNSLNVSAPPGVDAKQLAREIREELEDMERADSLSALNY